jgi:hypothetical protein
VRAGEGAIAAPRRSKGGGGGGSCWDEGFAGIYPQEKVSCCAYIQPAYGVTAASVCVAEVYVSRAASTQSRRRPVKCLIDLSRSLERREASVPIAVADQVAATAQSRLRAPAVASVQLARKKSWARPYVLLPVRPPACCRAARCSTTEGVAQLHATAWR